MHRFCENEEKESYFSRCFDCIWPWNDPWFSIFFPISLFLIQYCFWSLGGCLLKVFIEKLPICIVFVQTKKKIPNFYIDLIEFDHKTIPDFWFFFNISFLGPNMLLEYCGAPIESILSKNTNMHIFCGNEEKQTYFSCWFDWIWP